MFVLFTPSPIKAEQQDKTKDKTNSPDSINVDNFAGMFRPLASEFVRHFGRNASTNSECKYWARAFREMLKEGITPALIGQAFVKMNKDGLTIKSPASILAVAYDLLRKEKVQQEEQERYANMQNMAMPDSIALRMSRGEKIDIYKPIDLDINP